MIGQGKGLDVELLFGFILLRRESWKESAHLIEPKAGRAADCTRDWPQSVSGNQEPLLPLCGVLAHLCMFSETLACEPTQAAQTWPEVADQHTASAP